MHKHNVIYIKIQTINHFYTPRNTYISLNPYQIPDLFIRTAIGDTSYENLASGISSSEYYK
jgi:hypothetical protein